MGNQSKITIITSSGFPYGKSGENFIRNISLGLSSNNTHVHVVRYRGRLSEHKNDTGISCSNYLYRKIPKSGALKGLQVVINSIYSPFFVFKRKIFHKDEVFLIFGLKYSYELIPLLFWSKILNIRNYQIIADYYNAKSIVPSWWKKPKYYAYVIQRKYFDRFYNGLIVLSQFLKDEAVKHQVSRTRILVVPHFIKFQVTSKSHQKDIQKNIITYCGTLSFENGIIDLIKAFNIIKKQEENIELRLVGGADNELLQLIKDENLDLSNVVFTGFVEKEEVELEMLQSSILVSPRRESDWANAGFPTKIGEYFSTKTPVVITAVGDLPSYFKNKEEVVFAEANNPSSIAEAILYIIAEKDQAVEIAEKGYLWAMNNLDYIANSKKVKDFIYTSNSFVSAK